MALVFPNDDTLRMALTSGLVPPTLSLSPARCSRQADGAIALTPRVALPDGIAATLGSFGIDVRDDAAPGIDVAHWLEALPLYRLATIPAVTEQSPILLEINVD